MRTQRVNACASEGDKGLISMTARGLMVVYTQVAGFDRAEGAARVVYN